MKRSLVVAALTALTLATAACGTSTSTSGAGGDGASAKAKPKVAALFTQFVDQGNWDVAGHEAYEAMCTKYDLECTYVEQATYEKAPALLRGYGQQGYDMVIAHSSGFDAAIKEVAPEFPDTQFALFSYATDTGGLKNYSAWSVDWDQVGYLQGVLGGLASKSGNIAVVGGEQIPSTKRTMDLATAGAQSVNKAAKVENVWIGSFVDVAKGRQVALQSINKGADFLIPIADLAGEGVKQAADESGALCLGEYIDESSSFPKSIVTSVTVDMVPAFDQMGKGLVDGTLSGKITNLDASTGTLGFAPFHNVTGSELQTKAESVLAGLADGSVKTPAV